MPGAPVDSAPVSEGGAAIADGTEALARELGRRLLACGRRVATAESCTGGGIAEAITSVAGSSGWFEYGLVTYANRAKVELLGVAADTLAAEGAVSEAVVREMASGALRLSGADFAVAVSGIAGPGGGTDEKPVGTVWFCWGGANPHLLEAERYQLKGDRAAVRAQAVRIALEGLLARLPSA